MRKNAKKYPNRIYVYIYIHIHIEMHTQPLSCSSLNIHSFLKGEKKKCEVMKKKQIVESRFGTHK